MDPTVCVDALAFRDDINPLGPFSPPLSPSGHSLSSYSCRLVLIQNLQTSHVIIAMAARPPITPPAIGPAADELLLGEDDGVADGPAEPDLTQEVDGHAVHDCAERRHVSSAAQTGQEGDESGGHCTHRRNSEGRDDFKSVVND